MTTELYWLVLTLIMTALFWIPYILNRIMEQGILNALWDPQGITKTEVVWADRMMKAHSNAVENLVIFAPLVITLHITGLNTSATATATMVFFFTRMAHFLVFTFGVPVLRVVTFVIGFVVQMVLAFTLVGVI